MAVRFRARPFARLSCAQDVVHFESLWRGSIGSVHRAHLRTGAVPGKPHRADTRAGASGAGGTEHRVFSLPRGRGAQGECANRGGAAGIGCGGAIHHGDRRQARNSGGHRESPHTAGRFGCAGGTDGGVGSLIAGSRGKERRARERGRYRLGAAYSSRSRVTAGGSANRVRAGSRWSKAGARPAAHRAGSHAGSSKRLSGDIGARAVGSYRAQRSGYAVVCHRLSNRGSNSL